MLGILRLEFYMKIQARTGKTIAFIIDKAGKTQTFTKKRLDFSNKVCGQPEYFLNNFSVSVLAK